MFGRIRYSRNAKNRPKKKGEIYGDNINSVVDVAYGLNGDGVPLGEDVAMISDDRTMMVMMGSRKDIGPVMGVDMPGRTVDQRAIKKLKFGRNERFEASDEGDKYVLDTGKVKYSFPTYEEDSNLPVLDVKTIEANETSLDIDSSVFEELYQTAKKDPWMKKHLGKEESCYNMAAILVSDRHGMSAMLAQGGSSYLDIVSVPRIISTRGTEGEHVAVYPLTHLRNIVKANPKGRLSFDTDHLLVFTWDDPTYEGRMIMSPIIYDEEDSLKIHSDALANHRAAFGSASANRRPSSRRRT